MNADIIFKLIRFIALTLFFIFLIIKSKKFRGSKNWGRYLTVFGLGLFSFGSGLSLIWDIKKYSEYAALSAVPVNPFIQNMVTAGLVLFIVGIVKWIPEAAKLNKKEALNRELKKLNQKYQDTADELHRIIDHLPCLLFYKDLENRYIKVNKKVAEAHNATVEELEGKSIFELYPKEEAEKYWQDDLEVIKSGQPKLNIEEPFDTNEGRRWVNTSKIPFVKDGQIIGIIGISSDITERKIAEEKLKESEKKYRRIFNQFQDIYYRSDLNGIITELSPSVKKLSGYSPDELIGKPVETVYVNPENRKILLKKIKKNGVVEDYDIKLKKKNGEKSYASVSSHVVKDENGNITGIEGTLRDITSRKKAEKLERKLAERIEAGLRSGNFAWWEMELPSGDVKFDDNKAKLLGYSHKKFKKYTDFMDLVHPDDYSKTMKAMEDHINGVSDVYEVEYRIKTAEGTYKWFKDVGAITEKDKEIGSFRVIGIANDISDRKEEEKEKETAQKKLFYLRKSEAIGQFAGGIAHNFNNILTGIIGEIQLLQEDIKDEKIIESLQNILKNSYKAKDLVDKISGFAHSNEPAEFKRIDLKKILNNIKGFLRNLAGKDNKLNVKINCPQNKSMICKGDAEEIEIIFENLVENAALASTHGDTITITCEFAEINDTSDIFVGGIGPGSYCKIIVTDKGTGMSEETKNKIFDPFFTTRNIATSRGLGLTVVKNIVQRHKGGISVKSSPGEGTEIAIYLPAVKKS